MARIEKVGVAWKREFKNKKKGIKLSIDKKLYVAFVNGKKNKDTDPDYIVVRFIDEPGDSKVEKK